MTAPQFSLVVATLGRVAELDALLASLVACHVAGDGPGFEVIVVDQNGDDRLDALLGRYGAVLALRHLRSPVRGLSHGRNLGIAQCAGAIIGFPDDDCIYPPGVLAEVAAAFAGDAALQLFSGAAAAPGGGLGSGRWHKVAAPITRANVWTTSIAFTLFLRRELLVRLGGFDERLGVGARFGAAEETDLVVRAIDAGAKARYDPALRVLHPDKQLSATATARAFSYGEGCGFVLRQRRFETTTVLRFMLRPLGGMLRGLLRGRALEVRYYWRSFTGRLAGYAAGAPKLDQPHDPRGSLR